MRHEATDAVNPAAAHRPQPLGWSAARLYLAISGFYLVALGIAGFVVNRTFPIGAADAARARSDLVFGLFETNGWHNLAGLVFGLIALWFLFRSTQWALGALAVGVPNLITFVAFAVTTPTTFWFASNGADAVLHALLGFGGVVAAMVSHDWRRGTQRLRGAEAS